MSKKWLDGVFGTIFQCSTSTKSLKGGEWGQRKSDIWQHPKFHWTVGFVENYSEPRSILNDARTVGIIVSEILAIAVNHQWEREKDFLLRLISSCLVDMNGENFFFLKYLMDFNYQALREGDILLDFFAQLPDMWV